MTSSNVHFLCYWTFVRGIDTGHRWIPRTKTSDAELWCFLWSAPEWSIEWGWCFETLSRALWRHSNEIKYFNSGKCIYQYHQANADYSVRRRYIICTPNTFLCGQHPVIAMYQLTHQVPKSRLRVSGLDHYDNDNDNERYLLLKLYKENQTIIQVHNSNLKDSNCQEVQWNQTLTVRAEVMTYVPQVHVNGRYI